MVSEVNKLAYEIAATAQRLISALKKEKDEKVEEEIRTLRDQVADLEAERRR